MELNLTDPGHDLLNGAFGIETRRIRELHHTIVRKLVQLSEDNPDAKWSSAIVIIANCCETKEEAIVMISLYIRDQTKSYTVKQLTETQLN